MTRDWSGVADAFAPLFRHPRGAARLVGPMLRAALRDPRSAPPMPEGETIDVDWQYDAAGSDAYSRLCRAAGRRRWTAEELPWDTAVEPFDPARRLFPVALSPAYGTALWAGIDPKTRETIALASVTFLLSQILHGEQIAFAVAGKVVKTTPFEDARSFGAIQVADEARHVEVFGRYLATKIGRPQFAPGRSLVALTHATTGGEEWDISLLGMEILEGLALGTFAYLHRITGEPLLLALLGNVIRDEARHAEYGVLALRDCYAGNPRLRRSREEWAFETCVMMHERFLFLDVHDQYFAHRISRREWVRVLREHRAARALTAGLFGRVIPNLRRIGLLSDRMRPHYERLGLLGFANARAADELAEDQYTEAGLTGS